MEHRRTRRTGTGAAIRRTRRNAEAFITRRSLTRSRLRNSLWLIAACGSVALVVAAVLVRPPGTGRAVRVAALSGAAAAFSQSGGGPGGPMAACPSGWSSGGWSGGSGSGGQSGSGGAGSGASGSATAAQGTGNAANATAATSQNWAGYAESGAPGTFTSVSSSWTEPAVTCTAQQTFSSFWVGLDGDGTQTVEQTGTEADCNNGAASYRGWFEMFPNAPVFYNNPVAAGDAMSASVVAGGGGAFTLTLSDQTQGWTQTTNQTSATAQLGSAEIIAEAPSDANAVLPLSNFGAVNFTNALVNNVALASANAAELTIVSAGGVAEAAPSALSNGGSFSVTWDSNGTANSPAPAATVTPAPTIEPASVAPTVAPASVAPTAGFTGYHHHHHHHGGL